MQLLQSLGDCAEILLGGCDGYVVPQAPDYPIAARGATLPPIGCRNGAQRSVPAGKS